MCTTLYSHCTQWYCTIRSSPEGLTLAYIRPGEERREGRGDWGGGLGRGIGEGEGEGERGEGRGDWGGRGERGRGEERGGERGRRGEGMGEGRGGERGEGSRGGRGEKSASILMNEVGALFPHTYSIHSPFLH